jgi:hypothetical protein
MNKAQRYVLYVCAAVVVLMLLLLISDNYNSRLATTKIPV